MMSVLKDSVGNTENGFKLLRCVTDDIALFAYDDDLLLLSHNLDQVFCDGTFEYSPKSNKQLYTFHVYQNGFYIPVAFFLVNKKNTPSYCQMLKMLRDECIKLRCDSNVQSFMLDFEMSMIIAVRNVFPDANIRCCGFHLGQNFIKKIGQLGLICDYKKSSSDIGKWLRKCFGISAIDESHVAEMFTEFEKLAPKDDRLFKFIEYLKKTYIFPNSIFPPSMWANMTNTHLQTTNNGCESFHRHLGEFIESSHPNIFKFVETLANAHIFNKVKARSKKPPFLNKFHKYSHLHNSLNLS